jgi:hypothetical protein
MTRKMAVGLDAVFRRWVPGPVRSVGDFHASLQFSLELSERNWI